MRSLSDSSPCATAKGGIAPATIPRQSQPCRPGWCRGGFFLLAGVFLVFVLIAIAVAYAITRAEIDQAPPETEPEIRHAWRKFPERCKRLPDDCDLYDCLNRPERLPERCTS